MMFVEIGDGGLLISKFSLLGLVFLSIASSANSLQILQTPICSIINRDFFFFLFY